MSDPALSRISATLGDLIVMAERVINRPLAPGVAPVELAALATNVDIAAALAIEGSNPIGGEALMLAQALAEIASTRDDYARVTQWRMVAGTLLPMVRDCAFRAIALRARAPSTTDQDYPRGRR